MKNRSSNIVNLLRQIPGRLSPGASPAYLPPIALMGIKLIHFGAEPKFFPYSFDIYNFL
jgi:hypothetical protein